MKKENEKRGRLNNEFFKILLGLIVIIFSIQLIFALPNVTFIEPTPSNGNTTNNTFFIINMSIVEDVNPLSSLIYNFNGNNYSYYDNSLLLMMNYNNKSSLGENSTKVVDVSRYRNNGTYGGGVIYNSSGKYGGAMNFDGTSAITVGDIGRSPIAGTIYFWINLKEFIIYFSKGVAKFCGYFFIISVTLSIFSINLILSIIDTSLTSFSKFNSDVIIFINDSLLLLFLYLSLYFKYFFL